MKRTQNRYEDIIFENRNKAFGAYQLRVNYHSTLIKSFFLGLSSLTIIAIIVYKINHVTPDLKPSFKVTDAVVMAKIFEIEKPLIANPILRQVNHKIAVAVAAPKAPIDPLSFKIVKERIEPLKPVANLMDPVITTPTVGSEAGPATVTMIPISGRSGLDLSGQVLSSAVVDKQPLFPGGMEAFYKFLSKHMRFPEEAKREGISGKLFVSFVINTEGNLVEIEFVKKAGFGMEESVATVLEKSPKWSPGLVGNQQVSTKMILPVSFNLVQ